MCPAGTFVVNRNLVLRNYIRGERHQLLVAANRCAQPKVFPKKHLQPIP